MFKLTRNILAIAVFVFVSAGMISPSTADECAFDLSEVSKYIDELRYRSQLDAMDQAQAAGYFMFRLHEALPEDSDVRRCMPQIIQLVEESFGGPANRIAFDGGAAGIARPDVEAVVQQIPIGQVAASIQPASTGVQCGPAGGIIDEARTGHWRLDKFRVVTDGAHTPQWEVMLRDGRIELCADGALSMRMNVLESLTDLENYIWVDGKGQLLESPQPGLMLGRLEGNDFDYLVSFDGDRMIWFTAGGTLDLDNDAGTPSSQQMVFVQE